MRTDRPRRGITLLETAVVALLLVLVAAIAESIWWPLRAGEHPRNVCLTRTKHQAISLLIYTVDHNNRLPAASEWMDGLFPYTKTWDDFKCPAVDSISPQAFGRAFVRKLGSKDTGRFSDQSKVVSLFDSSLLRKNATPI